MTEKSNQQDIQPTSQQLLTQSRFVRSQEELDRDAALASLDDTTLRPAFRYAGPDDTAMRAPMPASSAPRTGQVQARPRRVGTGVICALAGAFGVLVAIVVTSQSPRVSSVGLLGTAQESNEQQVTAPEEDTLGVPVAEREEASEEAPATASEPEAYEPEPIASPDAADTTPEMRDSGPETYDPVVEGPVPTTPAEEGPVHDEPQSYSITWTDDLDEVGGRSEHTLTYTEGEEYVTLDYDGYRITVTQEEFEWLFGDGSWGWADEPAYGNGDAGSYGYGSGYGSDGWFGGDGWYGSDAGAADGGYGIGGGYGRGSEYGPGHGPSGW